jgi:MFS family permease
MSHAEGLEPRPHNRPLDRKDYKTLSLAALGGALEFYDFVVYVFFAVTIGGLFFPPNMPDWMRQLQTFGIFAAGYLARPLGGVIIAHFGDLLGRKRMFTLSIFLMAVPTLAIGLLPTYAAIGALAPVLLLAMRVLQGAAIGGEVPGAWVFVSEHVPTRRTGVAVGTLTAGLTAGILLGSLVATAINKAFSPEEVNAFAFRIPFLLGGVFGLGAIYLRRFLEETPVFREMHERKALAKDVPLVEILRDHRGPIVLSMLFTWVLSAAIVVVILFTPTYLQKAFKVPAALALEANSIAIVALTIGCVLFGYAADRFGSRWTLAVGSIGICATSYVFYGSLPLASGPLIGLYALLGFFVGTVGAIPYVLVNAFPPALRFTGLSFSYNVSYAIFGGLTPVMLTLWLKSDPMAPGHYVGALAILGALLAFIPLPNHEAAVRAEAAAAAE